MAVGNDLTFRFYRNKINALCKKARSSYSRNNIADVQESNPRKWWSAVKSIAGLSLTKRFTTLTYEGQSYSDKDLANLLNDKFIAVGSSLPSLVWPPLTVDELPTDFYISVHDIAESYTFIQAPFICMLAQTKFLLGCYVRIPQYCVAPCALSLMHQSVKHLFHRC